MTEAMYKDVLREQKKQAEEIADNLSKLVDLFRAGTIDVGFLTGGVGSYARQLESIVDKMHSAYVECFEKAAEQTGRSIEVIYTGGGIWLACCYISDHVYAVYSDECPDYLSYYDHRDEDQSTDYPCQNWIGDETVTEMNRKQYDLFKAMKYKFEKESW